jgi:hypothetical protein
MGEITVKIVPIGLVLLPVTHHLIHSSAVENAVQATDLFGEMASEDRTWWRELCCCL